MSSIHLGNSNFRSCHGGVLSIELAAVHVQHIIVINPLSPGRKSRQALTQEPPRCNLILEVLKVPAQAHWPHWQRSRCFNSMLSAVDDGVVDLGRFSCALRNMRSLAPIPETLYTVLYSLVVRFRCCPSPFCRRIVNPSLCVLVSSLRVNSSSRLPSSVVGDDMFAIFQNY